MKKHDGRTNKMGFSEGLWENLVFSLQRLANSVGERIAEERLIARFIYDDRINCVFLVVENEYLPEKFTPEFMTSTKVKHFLSNQMGFQIEIYVHTENKRFYVQVFMSQKPPNMLMKTKKNPLMKKTFSRSLPFFDV